MAKEFVLPFPELFPEQEDILASPARFNVVAGGRDAGKTVMAIDTVLISHFGALNGFPVGFFLPDADAVLTAKRKVFSLIQPLLIGRLDRPRVDLINGGSIHFSALDGESIEMWDQLALVVVDDAARVPRIHDIWMDVLEPMLAQHRGHAWFFSKPLGMRNGFARLAEMADKDRRWSTFNIHASDNPYYDQALVERDRDAMQPEVFAQERDGVFVEKPIELSAGQTVIGRDETFRDWCNRLAADGLKVDSFPFTLEDRPAMWFIFDQIPSSIEDAFERTVVMMKCAQVGFTVMEILAMIYMGLKFMPAKVGMFLPDRNLAVIKSSQRFLPILRTVPDAYRLMVDPEATGGRAGEGNVMIRNMGSSSFFFLWTSGKGATESVPMDLLALDEVQEMQVRDMEKVQERLSASRIKFTLAGSTANVYDRDIHFLYKKGTMHQFWTHCPACGVSHVLDDHFPECIDYDPELRDYRYICVGCKAWLPDAQLGEWRQRVGELGPDKRWRDEEGKIIPTSIHFPQFLSPTITARNIIEAYWNADDMKNFYNRKLGKPYSDPSQVPINLVMLMACAAEGMRLGVTWRERAADTFMGIDQMGAFNVALICERLPSGHMALIHAEEIYSTDPFARCDVLLANYGVKVCVVETLPNYNDAKRFANRHPGIVFLAGYADIRDEMLHWGDSVPSKLERKTDEAERDRYTVTLDQYKCMQVAFARIQKMACVFPDPTGLVQELTADGANGMRGEKQLLPILKDRVWFHFMRTALIAQRDKEQNKYRRKVIKVGIDPHFSYAFMLMNVAWSRAHGTSAFIFPEAPDEVRVVETIGAAVQNQVLNKFLHETAEAGIDKCGGCSAFDSARGFCNEREVLVRAPDPACFMFVAA